MEIEPTTPTPVAEINVFVGDLIVNTLKDSHHSKSSSSSKNETTLKLDNQEFSSASLKQK